MLKLFHHPLCPFSRTVRLAFAELKLDVELVEERPWERRRDFLVLNPAGGLPVLVDGEGRGVCGSGTILAFLDDTMREGGERNLLLPGAAHERAEARRLFDWFDRKFYDEVTYNLVNEKVFKRFMTGAQGGGAPDVGMIHAGRSNIRYHLHYIGHLVRNRNWLAGEAMTMADLAAAAHISCVDYLGDVPWEESESAKSWYARIKSRPSFRALLAEIAGGMQPAPHYADLDF